MEKFKTEDIGDPYEKPPSDDDWMAVAPCGCVMAIAVADPNHYPKEFIQFRKDGFHIETAPRNVAVERFLLFVNKGCPHKAKQLKLEIGTDGGTNVDSD